MALAKDPARYGGRARAFDKGQPTGEILYQSNFGQNYFDGWRPSHFSAFAPVPPCGLTSYPTHSGKLALQLSTEMRTYASSNTGTQCTTFRGLSLYPSRRYLSYSGFFALGVGGYSLSWDEWGIYLDIQKSDNSSRSFPRLIVKADATTPNTYTKLRIVNNAGTEITVPGTSHLWPGDNENKQGFGYLRLTWDLQANGGLGGYKEAQMQNQVFDLTGLGGQSASTTPQTDSGSGQGPIAEYNSGLNLGLFVLRSSDALVTDQYPATLVADSIIVSSHD
jgi:hypothetical protein